MKLKSKLIVLITFVVATQAILGCTNVVPNVSSQRKLIIHSKSQASSLGLNESAKIEVILFNDSEENQSFDGLSSEYTFFGCPNPVPANTVCFLDITFAGKTSGTKTSTFNFMGESLDFKFDVVNSGNMELEFEGQTQVLPSVQACKVQSFQLKLVNKGSGDAIFTGIDNITVTPTFWNDNGLISLNGGTCFDSNQTNSTFISPGAYCTINFQINKITKEDFPIRFDLTFNGRTVQHNATMHLKAGEPTNVTGTSYANPAPWGGTSATPTWGGFSFWDSCGNKLTDGEKIKGVVISGGSTWIPGLPGIDVNANTKIFEMPANGVVDFFHQALSGAACPGACNEISIDFYSEAGTWFHNDYHAPIGY